MRAQARDEKIFGIELAANAESAACVATFMTTDAFRQPSIGASMLRLKNGTLVMPNTVDALFGVVPDRATSPRVSIGMAVCRCTLKLSRRT